MKVLSVSNAKAKLGRVIDQVIKTDEPVIIPRGTGHVMIAPYHLPSPDEMELMRVFRRMDEGREPIEEDSDLIEAIQKEVRNRSEKRRRR